jgi:ferric-dicitrate binding protein FerR (iron transport regulator)
VKAKTKYDPENPDFSKLGNYQSIDVEGDWKQVQSRIGFRSRKLSFTPWQAAAIILVVLSFGFLTTHYVLNQPELITISSGEQKKELMLPDGSQVYLNVNSELSYPEKFNRKGRNVSLSGEGFFKILRNPDKPFAVNISDRATVEVLGTSFNISAPLTGIETRVQVVEGSVALYALGKKDFRAILNKGDQAEISQGRVMLNSVPDQNFLSWQTGILYFKQSPIKEVVDQLETHYNREIIIDKHIPDDMVFTSTIDNQKLEDVLEEMSLVLELTITYNPDNITISKQP